MVGGREGVVEIGVRLARCVLPLVELSEDGERVEALFQQVGDQMRDAVRGGPSPDGGYGLGDVFLDDYLGMGFGHGA